MEIFSFGERLMIYRKRAGLSKKELAKRVGISVSTLTKYENDESQPNVDMLTDLAIALDISVMKLLSGFGDPIRDVVEKVAVMGNDDQCSAEVVEPALQPADAF